MAMAHSGAKPFHLISDTEASEACARPSDKVGGALHMAEQRLVDTVWVRVKAVVLSVHKQVKKKSNNKIWISIPSRSGEQKK